MAEIIKAAPAKAPGLNSPKLLKKESFAAMNEAALILDAARMHATRILAAAENQMLEIREEARAEGEAEGLSRYLQAIENMGHSLDLFFSKAEPQLVKLAAGMAQKIVGAELAAVPETIAEIVRQALASVRQARRVTIQVHPSQANLLRENVQRLDLSAACDVQVIAHPTITAGGCVIETELGLVDARLETQVQVMERLLVRRPS